MMPFTANKLHINGLINDIIDKISFKKSFTKIQLLLFFLVWKGFFFVNFNKYLTNKFITQPNSDSDSS